MTQPLAHASIAATTAPSVDAAAAERAAEQAAKLARALRRAAQDNDPVALEEALLAGADPSVPDGIGKTPLMLAAERGATLCVKFLLADPRSWAETSLAFPPVWFAVYNDRLECAKLLLRPEIDASRQYRGETLLHLAARGPSTEMTALLLGACDPMALNEYSDRPVDIALSYNQPAVADLLALRMEPQAAEAAFLRAHDDAERRAALMPLYAALRQSRSERAAIGAALSAASGSAGFADSAPQAVRRPKAL
jgi:hypothetical protein